ncbi:MAG: hypothetical protein MI867_28240 [Pseudomonadales bacterium]|nr:hypothetical protein [Pseudomonadales bacterium]
MSLLNELRAAVLNRALVRGYLFTIAVLLLSGCGADMPTREQIVEAYPSVVDDAVPENKNVLCPFLRLIERSGLWEGETDPDTSTIAVSTVVDGTEEFGCSSLFCNTLANPTAAAQPGPGGVNIEALHTAAGFAHECGLTFAFEGTEVDDATRQSTLDQLFELSDENGHLSYNDILSVKLSICESQNVEITALGEGEMKLIFAYLGGLDRGYVTYDDVERFLFAKLPETITTRRLTQAMLSELD